MNSSHRSASQRTGADGALNNFLDQAYRTGANVDQVYGVPARKKILAVGGVYPFTTALALTFGALSLLPILTFIGFALFTFISSVSTAILAALAFSGVVILGAGAILLGVLSFAFGVSVFFTVSGFMMFIAYRLAFHTQARDGQGVGAWITETMMRFGLVDIDGMRVALATPPTAESKPFVKPSVGDSNDGGSGIYSSGVGGSDVGGSGVSNGKAR